MDTALAILRRLIKGENIGTPDKEHFHHQLLARTSSVKKTVLLIYGIDLLFAIASVLYAAGNKMLGTNIYGIIIYVIILVLTIILVLKTNIIWDHDKKKNK